MSMYNYCDGTVHFKRRKCSTSSAVGVQLVRYIQLSVISDLIKSRVDISNSSSTIWRLTEKALKMGNRCRERQRCTI